MTKLEQYREEIEKIDEQLFNLLAKRMNVSMRIGEYKKENNLPIFDAKREEELREKNLLLVEEKYRHACSEVFELILKLSKDFQL